MKGFNVIMINRIKFFVLFSISAAIVFTPSSVLYAESVFLRNGNIVEGTIISEDDKKVEIKTAAEGNREIPRKDILRTLYHDKFKEKKVINKTDRTKVSGFIVEEDSESYTYRPDLNSSREMKINKDEIDSVSRFKTDTAGVEKEPEFYSPSGYYLRGIVPGYGQFYTGYYVKSAFYGLSFAASAVWMVYATNRYMKSRDDYESLSEGHTPQEFDDAYEKSEDARKTAIYSIATASVVYLLNWCDILFFSKPEFYTPVSSLDYGRAYVDLNIGSDYRNDGNFDYAGGLKAEMGVFIKF
jgi:hypothetical protein